MKLIFACIFFILFFNLISATCNSDQIDINSASLSGLDKLDGIGEVKAQAIIDGRPYSSLDDLLNVKGIGNVTLEKIKSQNLACLGSGESSNMAVNTPTSNHREYPDEVSPSEEELSLVTSEVVQSESIINLNQDVNLEQTKQTVFESKTERIRKYSIYGFAFFLIFLIIVLLIKN